MKQKGDGKAYVACLKVHCQQTTVEHEENHES
jgi:hypothetical protein